MKLDIRHDPGGGRFLASTDGEEATLLYTEAGEIKGADGGQAR